ncbi:PLR1 [Scenedesmus sp. PABB004]|nr:PLR1 [Scenedesmus sp. PABB004]
MLLAAHIAGGAACGLHWHRAPPGGRASLLSCRAAAPAPAAVTLAPPGTSPLSVSPLITGCWQLAGGHGREIYDGLEETLSAYADAGLTSFDTADIYGPSEALVGAWAAEANEEGPAVQLLTKYVPNIFKERPTPAAVEAAISRSLARLQVPQLDLVAMHWWDYGVPGMVDAALVLADLQAKGLIKQVGVTNMDVAALTAIVDAGVPVASNQVQFSLLDRRPLNGMLQLCVDRGIKLMTYGSLAGGLLSDRYVEQPKTGLFGAQKWSNVDLNTSSLKMYWGVAKAAGGQALWRELLLALSRVAGKHGAPVANVALAWVRRQGGGGVVIPIVGLPRGAPRVDDNLRALSLALDAEDLAAIDEVLARAPGPSGDIYSASQQPARGQAAWAVAAMRTAVALAALCCLALFVGHGAAQTLAEADAVTNTYFRPQSAILTTDASTEEAIPGLAPTDPARVQRSIPNLENLAPLLTMITPFLPYVQEITNALGIWMPNSWDLAETGPTRDWLAAVVQTTWDGLWGNGPRPMLAPMMLVAAPEAYKKLPEQIKTVGGLPGMPINPLKAHVVGAAVIDQLTHNMMLPRAPLLMNATNGTTVKTLGGVELTLVVKEDGRYLVSNTSAVKILSGDVRHGTNTFQIVDSFVVPKISLALKPPPPLLTAEELAALPRVTQMLKDSLNDLPAAIAGMPAAWTTMIVRQLPDHMQRSIKEIQGLIAAAKPVDFSIKTNPNITLPRITIRAPQLVAAKAGRRRA